MTKKHLIICDIDQVIFDVITPMLSMLNTIGYKDIHYDEIKKFGVENYLNETHDLPGNAPVTSKLVSDLIFDNDYIYKQAVPMKLAYYMLALSKHEDVCLVFATARPKHLRDVTHQTLEDFGFINSYAILCDRIQSKPVVVNDILPYIMEHKGISLNHVFETTTIIDDSFSTLETYNNAFKLFNVPLPQEQIPSYLYNTKKVNLILPYRPWNIGNTLPIPNPHMAHLYGNDDHVIEYINTFIKSDYFPFMLPKRK